MVFCIAACRRCSTLADAACLQHVLGQRIGRSFAFLLARTTHDRWSVCSELLGCDSLNWLCYPNDMFSNALTKLVSPTSLQKQGKGLCREDGILKDWPSATIQCKSGLEDILAGASAKVEMRSSPPLHLRCRQTQNPAIPHDESPDCQLYYSCWGM